MRGATVVTLPRFELESFLRVLQQWSIPIAHVAPPIAIAIAKHPAVDRYDLSQLRWVFSAAAPLGQDISEAVSWSASAIVHRCDGIGSASHRTTNPRSAIRDALREATCPPEDRPARFGVRPNADGFMLK
jgi:acyl-coenzyme A synthetase/AMP-(fatty) acid ligase